MIQRNFIHVLDLTKQLASTSWMTTGVMLPLDFDDIDEVKFMVIFLRSLTFFGIFNTLPCQHKLLASSCSKDVLRSKYHDYFFHRQEQLWRDNALKTLPALLNSSDMLCCGEDLGMVPACVQPVSAWMIFWCFNLWKCIFYKIFYGSSHTYL